MGRTCIRGHARRSGRDCKSCQAVYRKRHVDRNRAIIRLAKDRPCADCGIKFHPVAMDFDHVRQTKLNNVGAMVNGSTQTLLDEIEKCDVVCANCHRIRSFLNSS